MKQRLRHIADMEHCTVSDGQLDTILTVAEGDMRRAVTTLQSVHALRGVGTGEDGIIIDDDAIAEIAGIPPPRVIHELYQAIQSDLFDTMKTAVEEVCLSGYSAQAVLGCLLQDIITSPNLTELGRAQLAIRIAEAEKNKAKHERHS